MGDRLLKSRSGNIKTDSSMLLSTSTKTAAYPITDTDGINILLVSDTSANPQITLPLVATSEGRVITIKNTSTDKGKVLVTGDALIEGQGTVDLDFKNCFIQIVSDGTVWHIINTNITSVQKSYYPSITISDESGTYGCKARPYRDMQGNWYVTFNLKFGLNTGQTSKTITWNDFTFDSSIARQAVVCSEWTGARVMQGTHVIGGSSNMSCNLSTSATQWVISGEFAVTAKPTFVE